MKLEIINPSDKCFIETDDILAAKVVGHILGQGWYGLQDIETCETILSIFETPFNDADEYQQYIDTHRLQLAEVFESITYAGERTSLNNIGAAAERYAKALREKGATSCVV